MDIDMDFRVTEKERDPADAKIKVIGVGGGGNNALNRMISKNISNVDYIAINTDLQDLNKNLASTKFPLVSKKRALNNDKSGLGAGGKPEIAKEYAEECAEDIEKLIEGSNMVFVTAGMGGGTGTGAAPVIAKIAKSKGILTVAVVTKPFDWEGDRRLENAEAGIAELMKNIDTLFVIPNDKLLDDDEDCTMDEAFLKADEVLMQCITGITNIIRNAGVTINLDFADIDAVMRGKGYGHVGIGYGEGDNKVSKAIAAAKASPLLETSIVGAKSMLVNVVGADVKLKEVTTEMQTLKKQLGKGLTLFFGYGKDETLGDKVYVTLIATELAEEAKPKDGYAHSSERYTEYREQPPKEEAGEYKFMEQPERAQPQPPKFRSAQTGDFYANSAFSSSTYQQAPPKIDSYTYQTEGPQFSTGRPSQTFRFSPSNVSNSGFSAVPLNSEDDSRSNEKGTESSSGYKYNLPPFFKRK